MRIAFAIGAAALVMVGLLTVGVAEEAKPEEHKTQLKLNLAPKDTRSLLFNVEGDVHWAMEKTPIDLHVTVQMDCEVTVESVDAQGNYIVQLKQKRIAYGIKGFGPEMSFDSDAPVDKAKDDFPYQRAYLRLPIRLKLDPSGQPLEVLDLDKLVEALKERKLTVAPDDAKREAEIFMRAMKLVMAPLPSKPIGVGDKWTMQTKIDGLEVDATHKLTAFRDGIAYVLLIGSMKIDLGELNGPIHGEIQIDQPTGWLKREVIDLKLTGKGDFKVEGTLTVTGK